MSKKELIYNMFKDIESPALRAWNQLQYIRNLEQVHGTEVTETYYDMLTEAEKLNVLVVSTRILVRGEDFVRTEVLNFKG